MTCHPLRCASRRHGSDDRRGGPSPAGCSVRHRLVRACLQRHEAHDWGEVSQPDAAANELAASGGGQVLSSYAVPRHVDDRGDLRDRTLCVITDAAGPASVSATTTVLFPTEY